MSQSVILDALHQVTGWIGHRALREATGLPRADFKSSINRLVRHGRILRTEEEVTYVNAAGRRLRQIMGVYCLAGSERVHNVEPMAEVPWLGTVLHGAPPGLTGRQFSPLGAWE